MNDFNIINNTDMKILRRKNYAKDLMDSAL